jgi:hypothetical protein
MGKSRLKAKKYLVLMLAVILAGVTVATSSFSWFTRPGSSTGKALKLAIPYKSGEYMTAYDGSSVTMNTYVSTNEGVSWSQNPAPPATQGTLAPNTRVYYKTVLANTSANPQNVSLYIKNLVTGSSGYCCVGVNEPIKAFKNYSQYGFVKPSPSKSSAIGWNTKRIYFKAGGNNSSYDNESTGWSDGNYYVCSGTSSTDIDSNNGSAGTYNQFHKIGTGVATSSVYYADIPADHNKLFICVQNWNRDCERTQTFTNLSGDGLTATKSIYYELNSTYTGYHNAWANKSDAVGANLLNYYNTSSLGVGESINLGLTNSDYSGTLTYSVVSGSNYITLNTSTGAITGEAPGTAKIRYTVQSNYGETRYKECTITVKSYAGSNNTIQNAPIVTNLLIPANTEQNIYWFIQNGDETYSRPTGNVNYQLECIYLGV